MSVQMAAISAYLRLFQKPKIATPDRARRWIHAPKRPARPPASLHDRHEVICSTIEGFQNFTVAPRGRDATVTVVYLHGGAYVSEIVDEHWALISRLADAGARVEVPIYGLAPQYSHRHAYPLVTSVYRRSVTDSKVPVVLMGDSAGAGLSLGFAQTLTSVGLPQPDRIVLISPWLDLTLSNPEIASINDPMLHRVGLLAAGRAWADGTDLRETHLSPIHGSTADLAPLDIYIGTNDLLYPDVLRLCDRHSGSSVTLTVCHGGVHAYPLIPAPEGRRAADAIVRSVTVHAGQL